MFRLALFSDLQCANLECLGGSLGDYYAILVETIFI